MRIRNIAMVLLALTVTMGSALAAPMSAQDKKLLARLSPELRKEVVSRLTPGETVRGILEVMLLNRLSMLSAEGYKEVIVDHERGTAVITYPNGRKETVKFDITTYEFIK